MEMWNAPNIMNVNDPLTCVLTLLFVILFFGLKCSLSFSNKTYKLVAVVDVDNVRLELPWFFRWFESDKPFYGTHK